MPTSFWYAAGRESAIGNIPAIPFKIKTDDTTRYEITGGGRHLFGGVTDDGTNLLQVGGSGYFAGNLGVGTSSPSNKIDIHATSGTVANFQADFGGYGSAGVVTIKTNTSASSGLVLRGNGSSAIVYGGALAASVYNSEAGPLLFGTGNTERMRLDASGNLGLGVTPSAWYGNRRVLQIGGLAVSCVEYASAIGENAYNFHYNGDGVGKYQNDGPAAIFDFNNRASGGFAWTLAPSGTAGNTTTFTQAMTLNASGRLLLGTATDDGSNMLQVAGSGSFGSFLVATQTVDVKGNAGGTTAGSSPGFQISDTANARYARFELGSDNKVRLFIHSSSSWVQQAVWG